MAGLAVQNFVSGGSRDRRPRGIDPGDRRRAPAVSWATSGSDLVRITLYLLLPISIIGALFLVSQGVIQNLSHQSVVHTLSGGTQMTRPGTGRLAGGDQGARHQRRRLLQRQLRLPVREPERPDQLLRDAADPRRSRPALTYTYGRMVGSQRQGWAVFGPRCSVLFVVGRDRRLHRRAARLGRPSTPPDSTPTRSPGSTGGNMEGKDQRFGIAGTSLWTAVTTVTSCGAVERRARVADRARPDRSVREPRASAR